MILLDYRPHGKPPSDLSRQGILPLLWVL